MVSAQGWRSTRSWVGCLVASVANAALLYMINLQPGWGAVPFLTPDAEQVLAWVNASVAGGLLVNIVQLVGAPPRLVSIGEMASAGIAAVAVLRTWQVFPFAFHDAAVPWSAVTRAVLFFAFVGCFVAVAIAAGSLWRASSTEIRRRSHTPTLVDDEVPLQSDHHA